MKGYGIRLKFENTIKDFRFIIEDENGHWFFEKNVHIVNKKL